MDDLLQVLRVLLALAAVGAALWWLQRRAVRRGRAGEADRPVRVLARQGLAAKAQLVLIEADGRRMLLGVTEHSVAVLRDAPADEANAPADLPSPAARGPVPELRFDSALERAERAHARRARVEAAPAAPFVAAPSVPQPAPAWAGSILSPATWRLAFEALRAGRSR